MATTYQEDVRILGVLYATGGLGKTIDRSNLTQDTLEPFVIPLTAWKTHDAMDTNLPAAAATDDLGLVSGTLGSNSPTLQAGDLKAAGATTRYARAQVVIPIEYEDGETVVLRFHGGMKTTVADVNCTLDVQAYRSDEEEGVGADICATSVQNMNDTAFECIDFTITPASLSAGDTLDVRIAVMCNDAATVTAVIPVIGSTKLLCDVRG